MKKNHKRAAGALFVTTLVLLSFAKPPPASNASIRRDGQKRWIGTWATAPQPAMPRSLQSFRNQSLRLIVHTSAGGTKGRIRVSNAFGDQPVLIGAAHIARRTAGA